MSPHNERNVHSTRNAEQGVVGMWRSLPLEAKILLSVLAVGAALVFTAQWASYLRLVGDTQPNPVGELAAWEGKSAPELTILTLDGQEVGLSSLRGKRVVVDF